MNLHKHVTEKTNTDRNRFSRYCMKAAAGALTLVMIGGCVPAVNPLYSQNGGWTIEASAAETDSRLNEDGSLKDGSYALPLWMKTANKTSSSMAASCITGAVLEVKDGKATVTVNLQSKTMGPITAWANNWKIYQENSTEGKATAADYTVDEEGNVVQIQFELPEYAYEAGGVYVSMEISVMPGVSQTAWFDMNFDRMMEDGVYAVNGTMQKPDGTSSMSDGAIAHAIKLTVQEGEYYLTMNFKGLNVAGLRGYFSNLKYYNTGYTVGANGNPTGDLTDVTVESVQKYTDGEILSDSLGTNYPDIVTFPLIPEALTDGRVPLQVFVPIMEELSAGSGTQNVYLVLDWDSVSKTTADDAVFAEGDVIDEKPSQTPEEDDQNPGGNQGNEEKPSKDPDEGDQNNKPFENTQNPGSDAGQNQNNQNQSDQNTAPKPGGAQAAALTAGATYTAGGNTYQATSGGTVTVKTVANKKSVNIPATVTVGGVKAKVTAIGNNAFKKAKKKLTKVTIGANVTSIGKKTFAGCKKPKKITIKSKKLASVGAKAFKGISKNATIKTPKAKKKAYAKLLKNKGQAKSVKIR